jgi:hypothetical protein
MPNVSGWRRLGTVSAVALGILALASSVSAQASREEPRLALLIGNSAYRESRSTWSTATRPDSSTSPRSSARSARARS